MTIDDKMQTLKIDDFEETISKFKYISTIQEIFSKRLIPTETKLKDLENKRSSDENLLFFKKKFRERSGKISELYLNCFYEFFEKENLKLSENSSEEETDLKNIILLSGNCALYSLEDNKILLYITDFKNNPILNNKQSVKSYFGNNNFFIDPDVAADLRLKAKSPDSGVEVFEIGNFNPCRSFWHDYDQRYVSSNSAYNIFFEFFNQNVKSSVDSSFPNRLNCSGKVIFLKDEKGIQSTNSRLVEWTIEEFDNLFIKLLFDENQFHEDYENKKYEERKIYKFSDKDIHLKNLGDWKDENKDYSIFYKLFGLDNIKKFYEFNKYLKNKTWLCEGCDEEDVKLNITILNPDYVKWLFAVNNKQDGSMLGRLCGVDKFSSDLDIFLNVQEDILNKDIAAHINGLYK